MPSSVIARHADKSLLTLSLLVAFPYVHAQSQCVQKTAQTMGCRTPGLALAEADRTVSVLPNVEARLVGWVEYNRTTCVGVSGNWTITTPPTRGTTRTQVMSAPLSNGDCPGVSMPFNVILYTWTSTEKNVFTDTFDAVWQSPNFTNVEHFDITLAHVEVTLTAPPPENKYLITAAPAMPVITASAKVVGVVPDPTPTTTFTWTANLVTKKGTGQNVSHKDYIVQDKTTTGSAPYTFELADAGHIIGGTLSIEATAVVNGATLAGVSPAGTVINGTNPARTNIQARVDTAVGATSFAGLRKADVMDGLKRIGCQESRQRQFRAAADGGTGPGLISPDNGVGIFQITSGNPIAKDPPVVYDWRENTDAGADAFSSKAAVAKGYPGSLRGSVKYKAYVSETINQARCTSGLNPIGLPAVVKKPADTYAERCLASLATIPGDAPATNFTNVNLIGADTVNQQLEDGVRGYNGYAGPKLFGLVLHEFRPDGDFLVTVPDSELGTLAADSDVWTRVPVADRGTAGDPDYVANVTSKQPTCN